MKNLKMRIGSKFNIDCEFDNERLIDTVNILNVPTKKQRKVLVHSPKLCATILIFKKELKSVL